MDDLRLHVDGVPELLKHLDHLASEKTAIKVQRRAATAAIRPMRNKAKSECPKHKGGLKKSIASKVSNKGLAVSAIVGSDVDVLESGERAHREKDDASVRAAAEEGARNGFGNFKPGRQAAAVAASYARKKLNGKWKNSAPAGVRAARHLHLVIHGHIARNGKAVAANDFLTRAYDATIRECESIYAKKLAEEYDKAAGGQ